MNYSEYQELKDIAAKGTSITAMMLLNRQPRTLMMGGTVERNTFHLYLNDLGVLQLVVYDHNDNCVSYKIGTLAATACVPDKRVYPALCDFEFCALLTGFGVSVPFTTFEDMPHRKGPFFGKKMEELSFVPDEHLKVAPPMLLLEELMLPNAHFAMLGLSERTRLESRIDESLRGALNGAVRALVFPGKFAKPESWLLNILPFMEKDIVNAFTELSPHLSEASPAELAELYSMPKSVRDLIVSRGLESLNQHLVAIGREAYQASM